MTTERRNAGPLPLPSDKALVGLPRLLDVRWFARAVGDRLLPAAAAPTACAPVYVRYKPGTNAVVVFALSVPGLEAPLWVQGKCLAEADYGNAREKALNSRWSEPALGAPLAACDDERILLLAFPNDPVLDGLRHAAHPKRMQRAVHELVPGLAADEWRVSDSRLAITPIRLKPEKRAVLRLDTRAVAHATGARRRLRLYLRVDADGRGAHDAAVLDHIHRALADHEQVGCPRPAGYDRKHRLLVVEDAGGEAISGGLNARAMGLALAALHALPAPALACRPIGAHLDSARETAGTVGALDPALGDEALRVLEALMRRAGDAAGAPALAHGDCHPGQVLATPDRVVLLDFDRSHIGDPAADLGNYLAHLDLLALAAPGGAGPLGAALVDSYVAAGGRRPEAGRLATWRALGLLQLATTPFRALDPAWPSHTALLLARAREVLA